jgi:hypothetical protein
MPEGPLGKPEALRLRRETADPDRAPSALGRTFDRSSARAAAVPAPNASALEAPDGREPSGSNRYNPPMARPFEELRAERRLRSIGVGRLSESFYSDERPDQLVKRFSARLRGAPAAAWLEIHDAVAARVAADAGLSRRLEVVVPEERGEDYLVRRYLALGSAVPYFANAPASLRQALQEVASALRAASARDAGADERSRIVHRVLLRSASAESDNLFWDHARKRLVLAEPKIEEAELKAWLEAGR